MHVAHVETLRDISAATDMEHKFWAERGDHRDRPEATRVITTSEGDKVTHFARRYTPGELKAIADFERYHDC